MGGLMILASMFVVNKFGDTESEGPMI